MKPTPLRTPEEVAARLQVGVKTVRALACARKLVGIKVGPAWRFDDADIDAYLTQQRRPPLAGPAESVLPSLPRPGRAVDITSLITEPRRFS